MKANKIESELGIEPGPTLIELANLALKRAGKQASHAFELLSFYLPWLTTKAERAKNELVTDELLDGASDLHRRAARGTYLATPSGVVPFAHTGTFSDHFGLVLDRDKAAEELAVVYVRPAEPDSATRIVAPNLRELLGLIAISNARAFAQTSTTAEWLVHRKEYFGDDPSRMVQMEVLSDALCTIRGVRRPHDPTRAVKACSTTRFELSVPLSHPTRARLGLKPIDRARSALVRARRLFHLGELGRALTLAEQALTHGATRAPAEELIQRIRLAKPV